MAGRRSPARAAGTKARRTGAAVPPDAVKVRRAKPDDFAAVVGIDARVTGLAKPAYWQDVFRRYGRGAAAGRRGSVGAGEAAVDGELADAEVEEAARVALELARQQLGVVGMGEECEEVGGVGHCER